jgi:hypothetical protein
MSSSSVCVEETEISKSGSLTTMLLLLCPGIGIMAGGGADGAYLISCVGSQRISDQLRRGRFITSIITVRLTGAHLLQYGRMHPISCRLLTSFANNPSRLCPVPRFGYENPGCLQAYSDRAKGTGSIPTSSSGHNESRRSSSERCQDQGGRALSLLFRRYPPRTAGSQDAAL